MSAPCPICGNDHVSISPEGAARLVSAAYNLNGEADKLRAEMREALEEGFAMRAPAIPEWFQPTGIAPNPELPPVPPGLGDQAIQLASAIRCCDHSYVNENLLPPQERRLIGDLREAMSVYRKASEARTVQYNEQRLAQWPWAYAALVLAARPAAPAPAKPETPCPKGCGPLVDSTCPTCGTVDLMGALKAANAAWRGGRQ